MRSLLLTIMITVMTPVMAQDNPFYEEGIDLDALYQQIDDIIAQSPEFIEDHEQQILARRDSLRSAKTPEQRLQLSEQLFDLYKAFKNDSAIHYAEVCISLAESLQHPSVAGRYRALLAYQCSNTDKYTEAINELRKINKAALDTAGLVAYYNAWMHVCGEVGNYTQRENVRRHYYDLQNLYRDSVLAVTKEGSEEWLHLKMDILSARRQFQEALRISDKWLHKVKEGTHEYAYAAFYRSVCYDHLDNDQLAHYWLGKSAIADIRCAVNNQASLLFLADHLANEGDVEHARRYMEFSMKQNRVFYPRMRTYQIDPVINITEKSNQAALSCDKTLLFIAGGIIVLLLFVLFIVILKRYRTKP